MSDWLEAVEASAFERITVKRGKVTFPINDGQKIELVAWLTGLHSHNHPLPCIAPLVSLSSCLLALSPCSLLHHEV
jgi:hypothetical protein